MVSSFSPILWTMHGVPDELQLFQDGGGDGVPVRFSELTPRGGSPRRPILSSSVLAGAAPLHELTVVCFLLGLVCRAGWGRCGAAKLPAIPDLVVPWRGGWGDRVPLSCCAGGFLAGSPAGSTVPQWVVGVGGRRCCLWLCTVWLLCCCVWAVPCLVGCCVASRWVAAVAGAGGLVGACRRWLVWHCFLVSFGCRGGGQELVRGAGGEVDSPPHSCEGQQELIPHLKSHGAWLVLAGCGDLGDCGQPSSPGYCSCRSHVSSLMGGETCTGRLRGIGSVRSVPGLLGAVLMYSTRLSHLPARSTVWVVVVACVCGRGGGTVFAPPRLGSLGPLLWPVVGVVLVAGAGVVADWLRLLVVVVVGAVWCVGGCFGALRRELCVWFLSVRWAWRCWAAGCVGRLCGFPRAEELPDVRLGRCSVYIGGAWSPEGAAAAAAVGSRPLGSSSLVM